MSLPSTEFSAIKTDIPGMLIFEVTSVGDERGWFQEKFHQEKLVKAGLPTDFRVVQTNISFNKNEGVVRGFHAEPWDKYISVVKGRVFCAYVDLRAGKNFGKVVTAELDNNKAIYLPRGVANAFQTIEPETYYIYSVNEHWRPDNYGQYTFVNLADPQLNVVWPIPLEKSVMSERDKNHPMLKAIKPMDLQNG